MVLERLKYTKEYFLQVWRWLVEKKPVKTPPVLQVSSWSLGGQGCSWDTWRWCQKGCNIPRKVSCKFDDDWFRKSLSRLLLSSKSPPGVLEDMDVPEILGDGVRRVGTSQGVFVWRFFVYLKCVQALELTEIDISKGLKSVNFSIVFWLGRFLAKFFFENSSAGLH